MTSEYRVSFWVIEPGKFRENRSSIVEAESKADAYRKVLASFPEVWEQGRYKITRVSIRCYPNRPPYGRCHHFTDHPSGRCKKHRGAL